MTNSYVPSYYTASATPLSQQPALAGDARCDVAILGAGLTGLSAAIELAQAGYNVIVLEAERIGWGASGRSGGQAIFGYSCDQPKLEAMVGRAASRSLFTWSLEAVRLIHERCAQFSI